MACIKFLLSIASVPLGVITPFHNATVRLFYTEYISTDTRVIHALYVGLCLYKWFVFCFEVRPSIICLVFTLTCKLWDRYKLLYLHVKLLLGGLHNKTLSQHTLQRHTSIVLRVTNKSKFRNEYCYWHASVVRGSFNDFM